MDLKREATRRKRGFSKQEQNQSKEIQHSSSKEISRSDPQKSDKAPPPQKLVEWYAFPVSAVRGNHSACCFEEYESQNMTFCSNQLEKHFLCLQCATLHAQTELGKGRSVTLLFPLPVDLTCRTDFLCIDGSGCTEPFSESQIRGFLDTKTLAGWEQLITENEIKAVSLSRVRCSCSSLPSN
jgi:hypothetical protein